MSDGAGGMPVAVELLKCVKERVDEAHASGRVQHGVIDKLVQDEVNDRTNVLVAALRKRREVEREIQKAKPDVEAQYDAGGNVVREACYSKSKLEDLKRLRDGLQKLDRAIEKAVNEADYGPVRQLVGEK